jgi:hypothetical protein
MAYHDQVKAEVLDMLYEQPRLAALWGWLHDQLADRHRMWRRVHIGIVLHRVLRELSYEGSPDDQSVAALGQGEEHGWSQLTTEQWLSMSTSQWLSMTALKQESR